MAGDTVVKRFIVAVVILAGCGSATATNPSAFTPPKGAVKVEAGVWAKDGMLYGEDCARLRAITDVDGPGIASYGFVCSTP